MELEADNEKRKTKVATLDARREKLRMRAVASQDELERVNADCSQLADECRALQVRRVEHAREKGEGS